jgi:large subunit ribosomal protein L15
MTSKKKRQRGSRTHGGGSGKNRRGAGHRGGHGDAGRDKHEMHNHPPLGEEGSGFSPPEKVQDEVLTVDLRSIDEDAPLLAAEGVATETDNGYRVDARELVDDGHDADAVKVLGNGRVRHALEVVADEFSGSAREKLAAAGGAAVESERATDNTTNNE